MPVEEKQKITVVLVRDTFIKGKPFAEGKELEYELGDPDPNTGKVEVHEDLQHLKAAGAVVEKGTKGHEQYLAKKAAEKKAADKREAEEKKAPEAKK